MSILNSPRINFFGGIEVDVSVPNNETHYPIGKNGKKEPVFDVANAELSDYVNENNITDEQIIAMLREPASQNDSPYFTNGGWNIYGQHSVTANQVKVRSVGSPGSVSEASPLVNMPFYLLGSVDPETGQSLGSSAVMVDLNPLGSTYSQVVMGGIMIGTQDAPLLHLQGDRITGNQGLFRKIVIPEQDSPGSSMFAGSWQVTYSMKEIVAFGKTNNSDANKFIKQFIETQGATGIVVNFSFFEMCPKMTTDQVRKSYGLNEDERNPSVGRIIGTLALAFEGETAQYPDGRKLTDTNLGTPAYAEVTRAQGIDFLSVNLSLALTQENFRTIRDGYTDDKLNPAMDVGTLSVFAGDTQIGSILPCYTDYYQYGGIVDMALTSAQAKTAQEQQLSLQSGATTPSYNGISLVEQTYRIYSDDINVYVGEYGGDTQEIELQVRYLGQAIPKDTSIDVSIVVSKTDPDRYLDVSNHSIAVPAGSLSAKYTLTNHADADKESGFEQLKFALKDDADFILNTRKFKHTNFCIPNEAIITWDEVYKYALRYHYLNFQGMSTVFPLNNAAQITINKDGIKARTSSKYWPTSLYMPIVRSMSPSQVRLINAFTEGKPWDPKVDI